MSEKSIHRPNPEVDPLPTARLTGDATAADIESVRHRTSVFVYEWPVRLWHWVNALCILVLIVTGWFIASPLPTMTFAGDGGAQATPPVWVEISNGIRVDVTLAAGSVAYTILYRER